MSLQISLANIPNQQLSFEYGGDRYTLRLSACFGCMSCDVYINDALIVAGVRVVAGAPIIPAVYQFYGKGNFAILTDDDEIPYYDQFGTTQFLIFITPEEIWSNG